MEYVQLGEIDTYYEEHGDGEPVLLLHPGHADARAWEDNLPALAGQFRVFAPDRRGHGRTRDAGPMSWELVARDTIAFMETVVGGPAHVVGCSDGSIVALYVALARPDLVRRLVLCCGVFHHEGWLPGVLDLDEETYAFFVGYYGEVSPDGPEHFPVVYEKLRAMHVAEPAFTEADLARIQSPTLVMGGDRDEMPLEHLVATYRAIPRAELAILPGTGHGVPGARAELCNPMILAFLEAAAAETGASSTSAM